MLMPEVQPANLTMLPPCVYSASGRLDRCQEAGYMATVCIPGDLFLPPLPSCLVKQAECQQAKTHLLTS